MHVLSYKILNLQFGFFLRELFPPCFGTALLRVLFFRAVALLQGRGGSAVVASGCRSLNSRPRTPRGARLGGSVLCRWWC